MILMTVMGRVLSRFGGGDGGECSEVERLDGRKGEKNRGGEKGGVK